MQMPEREVYIMEQVTVNRMKRTQLILLLAAFLMLFMGGCAGKADEVAGTDFAAGADMTDSGYSGEENVIVSVSKFKTAVKSGTVAMQVSGGVDIDHFGSDAWSGGR